MPMPKQADCGGVAFAGMSLTHVPPTLHPTPFTPHSTPYTLHPTPYTLTPNSEEGVGFALNPDTQTPKQADCGGVAFAGMSLTHVPPTLHPKPAQHLTASPFPTRGSCGGSSFHSPHTPDPLPSNLSHKP
jgi:hypothetical protein